MPSVQKICTIRLPDTCGSLSIRALQLAVAIADEAARTDIEIHAATRWVDGLRFFDCVIDVENDRDWKAKSDAISRALQYIEARGDVFGYTIKRHIGQPGWLHFAPKDLDEPDSALEPSSVASSTLTEAQHQGRIYAGLVSGLNDPATLRAVATAIARQVGHGMAEKCEAQAEAAVQAITRLIIQPGTVAGLIAREVLP